jgi:N-methylhydantoinase A
MGRWLVGVDVGGTFTDLVALDRDSGAVRVAKVSTAARNQAEGLMEGLAALGDDLQGEVQQVVHGTTVATNAVLERKGAATGLITTAGFRDVLELRRRDRPHQYGLQGSFQPLVPRWHRFELPERIDAEGRVVRPLELDGLPAILETLQADGVAALAVCFLNSYANPVHEQAVAREIQSRWPNEFVSVSHEVLPEIREFERTSTTVLNAYVQPLMTRYLQSVERRLAEVGVRRDLLVVKSNGGLAPSEVARLFPVTTMLSGPAAGVVAGAAIGRHAGGRDIVTCDMGGTSLDVCLVSDGKVAIKTDSYLDFGLQCGIPMADIHTMGAGGGSIAFVGSDGVLQVGPVSAGADPGPAAYGRGGTRPTVTDANLVLGRLGGPGSPGLGGRLVLDPALAARAIEAEVARPLGLSVEQAAEAIVTLTNTRIASALRLVSIERGYSPRELMLVPFGGAGPLHASAMLRELELGRVVVPRYPGNTSALGCLLGETRFDFVRAVRKPLGQVARELASMVEALVEEGRMRLARGDLDQGGARQEVVADLSYLGQSHTIPVHFDPLRDDTDAIRASFEAEYRRRFGRLVPDAELVLTSLRASVIGTREGLDLERLAPDAATTPSPVRRQRMRLADGWGEAPVYRRDELPVGYELLGPALVEQADSTVYLEERVAGTVDRAGNLVMERM